jgi:hypothetical protein
MSRHCFSCGASAEATTPLGGQARPAPAAGDISLCFECGAVALFTGRGSEIRLPLGEESRSLNADPQVRAAQARIRAFQQQKRGRR